jgi:hypothetical protein
MLALVAIGTSGLLAFWSRDTAATHPALVQADLPPVIPVRDFWADRAGEWGYKASFDGTWMAWTAVEGTQDVVRIARTEDMKPVTAIQDVDTYLWDETRAMLHVVVDDRFWRVDPENPERDAWADVTPRGFHTFWISNRVSSSR